jgi:hypothetical protein
MMREHERDLARERLDFMRDLWLAQDAHGKTRLVSGKKPKEAENAPRYELEELNEHLLTLQAIAEGKDPRAAVAEARKARSRKRLDAWLVRPDAPRIKPTLLGPDGQPLEASDGEESTGGSATRGDRG